MSYTFTPEQLQKLPKWVVEKVAMLMKQIDDQKREIAELSQALDFEGTVAPGMVEIDPYGKQAGMDGRGPRCLPVRTAIDFHLAPYGAFRVQMREPGVLQVMSTHGSLAVKPSAANVIEVVSDKI